MHAQPVPQKLDKQWMQEVADRLGVSYLTIADLARATNKGGRLNTRTRQQRTDDSLTMLRKADVAFRLGVSTWTLARWVQQGKFPRAIRLTPTSPSQWRNSTVEAFIAKRAVARRVPPKAKGMMKQREA